MNNLIYNLRAIRKFQELTQQDIADKIGVKRSTYAAWEEERGEPNIHYLIMLSEVIGQNVDDLIKRRVVITSVLDFK